MSESAGQWLAVVGGEHEGGRYPLLGGDLTLGRGTDNDLVLPDIAVSRKHLRLISTAEGWHFRDLGSGNGTRLNGRVTDEGDLHDGDQLEVGNSVLEYLAVDRPPGKARSRAKRSSAALASPPPDMDSPLERRATQAADFRVYRRSRSGARVALWAALAASVILTLAVVTASWLTYRDTAAGKGHSAGLAHYRRGATAFQQGKWDDALREFRKAAAADPTLADADRAVREIRAYRDVYRRGMDLGGKGRTEEARGLLSGIPKGAAFHPEARAALKAMSPGKAASAPAAAPTATPKAAKSAKTAAPAAAPAAPAPAAAPTAPAAPVRSGGGGGVAEAMARYREGQFDDAARLLHAAAARGDAKAAKMAGDVRAFAKAQRAGAASLHAGKTVAAIEQLQAALKLDEGLGRGYRSTVARQLAEALARRAEDHLEDGRLKEAAKTAVKARSLVKEHKAAQAVLDKLVIKARELTLQAMKLRNPDPQAAIAKLKTALRITPRKSPEYARAQELLYKIEDSL